MFSLTRLDFGRFRACSDFMFFAGWHPKQVIDTKTLSGSHSKERYDIETQTNERHYRTFDTVAMLGIEIYSTYMFRWSIAKTCQSYSKFSCPVAD